MLSCSAALPSGGRAPGGLPRDRSSIFFCARTCARGCVNFHVGTRQLTAPDGRLVPGGLPEGVRQDNLRVSLPRPRSTLLADAFKRAGIVERTGRGIELTYYGQLRYGRAPPHYRAEARSVCVTLPTGPGDPGFARWVASEGRAGRRWSVSELLVLRALAAAQQLNAVDAAAVAQLDAERAAALLARLQAAGLVRAASAGSSRTVALTASTRAAWENPPG